MYHRLRTAWYVAQENKDILWGFEDFYYKALACGDPLTVLDLPKSFDAMMQAQRDITMSYWLSLAALCYIGFEILAISVTLCYLCWKEDHDNAFIRYESESH